MHPSDGQKKCSESNVRRKAAEATRKKKWSNIEEVVQRSGVSLASDSAPRNQAAQTPEELDQQEKRKQWGGPANRRRIILQ